MIYKIRIVCSNPICDFKDVQIRCTPIPNFLYCPKCGRPILWAIEQVVGDVNENSG